MNWDSVIGYLAALCSVTSYTPQAWKIIKTRATDSLSAPMYAINVVGFLLWLTFGILRNEWSLIVTNALILLPSGLILVMTLLPRAKKDAVANLLDPGAPRTDRSDEGTPSGDSETKW
ncbi:hypothetical protein DPM35_26570 [Mesorhizobium atlanticum]|uniref:Glutathione synthetase n=2 Tax=Mesorhizobium atlanticum TaxID=2233532 RepID=A0A330GJV0_9HYPH|nr:hypothetical protein DPM35_26570 [Mesorhizobium atlanticum]